MSPSSLSSNRRPALHFSTHFSIWFFILLILSFASVSSASSPVRSANDIPNPRTHPKQAGVAHPASVSDPDGILGPEAAMSIADALAALQAQVRTPGCDAGGPELAVVAVQHIRGGQLKDVQAAARSLHNSWGVGARECATGGVMLFAIADRHFHFSTGRGLKHRHALHDRTVDFLFDTELKPLLKQGRHAQAAALAVRLTRELLEQGEAHHLAQGAATQQWWHTLRLGLLAVGVVVAIAASAWEQARTRRQRQQYADAVQRLRAIEAMRDGGYGGYGGERGDGDGDGDDDGDGDGDGGEGGSGGRRSGFKDSATLCPICLDFFPEEQQGSRGSGSGGGGATVRRPTPVSAAATTTSSPRLRLRCGHSHCQDCMAAWVAAGNNTCPVCRRDMGVSPPSLSPRHPRRAGAAAAAARRLPPHLMAAARRGSSSSSSTEDDWGGEQSPSTASSSSSELEVYLAGMRHRYPRFVTERLLHSWSAPGHCGSFCDDAAFVAAEPQVSSGGGGSSGSGSSSHGDWGGGDCDGGGGGGGSW